MESEKAIEKTEDDPIITPNIFDTIINPNIGLDNGGAISTDIYTGDWSDIGIIPIGFDPLVLILLKELTNDHFIPIKSTNKNYRENLKNVINDSNIVDIEDEQDLYNPTKNVFDTNINLDLQLDDGKPFKVYMFNDETINLDPPLFYQDNEIIKSLIEITGKREVNATELVDIKDLSKHLDLIINNNEKDIENLQDSIIINKNIFDTIIDIEFDKDEEGSISTDSIDNSDESWLSAGLLKPSSDWIQEKISILNDITGLKTININISKYKDIPSDLMKINQGNGSSNIIDEQDPIQIPINVFDNIIDINLSLDDGLPISTANPA
jgi:hypothetical protein